MTLDIGAILQINYNHISNEPTAKISTHGIAIIIMQLGYSRQCHTIGSLAIVDFLVVLLITNSFVL